MSETHTMFSVTLKKQGDKLVYANPAKEALYKTFVESLPQGHHIEVFFDADADNGTLAQLAKINACIRELAKETGNSIPDMKKQVKEASGLKVGDEYKSMADCSKDELSLVIETIIQMGDFVKINFR